jgi:hypothetical protein
MLLKLLSYLAVLIVGAGIGAGALLFWQSPVLYDEWVCARDEAPVIKGDAGLYCEKLDKKLPAGDRWDPLGNHPFECANRAGWVEVTNGEDIQCFRKYTAPPEGWTFVK